jgi:TonB family protein
MLGWNETAWFSIFIGAALKSTAVLGVAWLFAFLLRGRSAAARHLVWTAAAAAVLALPFLSISLPALPVAASALVPDVGVLFRTTATAHLDAANSQSSQRTGGAPTPSRSLPWRPDWRLSLMLLWAAGSVAAFTQMLVACAGMWRIRRAARPSPDRRLSVELAQELGIRHAVDVLETAEGTMPMTFGILRPAVFMPSDSVEWTAERRRIVLLHELAHVSRGDVATQLVARLAVILNWWNPLAWTAWREFLKERERATDDLVLHAGACASDYASHLLEVARSMQPAPNLGWAAVAMARRSQLEGRLLAILDSGVNRKTAGRASALAAVMVAVAIVAPLAAVRAQEKPSPAILPDVDATIRAATAQKNPEMLEKPAAAFEASKQYETAQKLVESAVAIREEVSGKLSVDYGVGLMKIADLEKKRNHPKEAEAFYNKAWSVLGDRAEAAPALMYLGIRKKDPAEAIDFLEKAKNLDPALAGPATMWMALVQERRQQNPEEAEALYKSALALENPDSADAINTRELYARLLTNQGREEEAKAMRDSASVAMQALYAQDRVQHSHVESTTAFRIGGGVAPPSVLFKMDPEYTEEARLAKYSGTVVLAVQIFPDGTAQNIRVVKGIGLGLDEKAVEAINKWRFKPGTKDGVAVTVAANIEVNFRLL